MSLKRMQEIVDRMAVLNEEMSRLNRDCIKDMAAAMVDAAFAKGERPVIVLQDGVDVVLVPAEPRYHPLHDAWKPRSEADELEALLEAACKK